MSSFKRLGWRPTLKRFFHTNVSVGVEGELKNKFRILTKKAGVGSPVFFEKKSSGGSSDGGTFLVTVDGSLISSSMEHHHHPVAPSPSAVDMSWIVVDELGSFSSSSSRPPTTSPTSSPARPPVVIEIKDLRRESYDSDESDESDESGDELAVLKGGQRDARVGSFIVRASSARKSLLMGFMHGEGDRELTHRRGWLWGGGTCR